MEATFYLWYKGTFTMIRHSDIAHVFCKPNSKTQLITEI